MTPIRLIMLAIVLAWGVWALILVVRRSWDNNDCSIAEMSGYVLFALVIIVVLRLMLMLIGVM